MARKRKGYKNNSELRRREVHQSLLDAFAETKEKFGKYLPFVHGDLQDMPDDSKRFNQGKCRIKKNPLGIVKLCEEQHMMCTMYKFCWDLSLCISRYGAKGVHFIDGCFTDDRGMQGIRWAGMVNDTCIASEHSMHVNRIDLNTSVDLPSADKEETIYYKVIIAIPMKYCKDKHPSINDTVFKRTDYMNQSLLYQQLNEIMGDKNKKHKKDISKAYEMLEDLEQEIIARTKQNISKMQQQQGKRIEKTLADSKKLDKASALMGETICNMKLMRMTPTIRGRMAFNKRKIIAQGTILSISMSAVISGLMSQAKKRIKSIYQRSKV